MIGVVRFVRVVEAIPKILAIGSVAAGLLLLLAWGVQRVTATTDRMVACVERQERENVLAHDAAVQVCATALHP